MVGTTESTLSLSARFLALGRSREVTLTFMMSLELRSMTSVTCGEIEGLQMARVVYINLIRNTINPKDGAASDINGYVRNVLARFAPCGDRFNVPRFMWTELRFVVEDGRRGLP